MKTQSPLFIALVYMVLHVGFPSIGLGQKTGSVDTLRAKMLTEEADKLIKAGKYREGLDKATEAAGIVESHEAFAAGYADALHQKGTALSNLSKNDSARSVHEEALLIRRKLFGDKDTSVSQSLTGIGIVLFGEEKFDSAALYFQKSLDIMFALYGDNHLDVAAAYNNLGACVTQKHAFDQAIAYHQKSLAIRQKLDPKSADIGDSFLNLGNCYFYKGEYDQAFDFYTQARGKYIEVHGNIHPSVANVLNALGVVFTKKRTFDKALEYLYQSLEVRQKFYGVIHDRVADSYTNIGDVYSLKGDARRAVQYFQKALTIDSLAQGPDHEEVGKSYLNIGVCHFKLGERERCLAYFNKALVIFQKRLAPDDPSLVHLYSNMGIVYAEKGDFESALKLQLSALQVRIKIYGDDHPWVASSCEAIGKSYFHKKDFQRALQYQKRALEIRLKKLGPDHPEIADLYNDMAVCTRDYDERIQLLFKALNIRLKSGPPDHPEAGGIYNNLGVSYSDLGHYDKALFYYEKAKAIYLKIFTLKTPKLINLYNNISVCHYHLGEVNRAVDSLRLVLSFFNDTASAPVFLTLHDLYTNLGGYYDDQRDYTQAIHYYEKAWQARIKLYGTCHAEAVSSLKDIANVYTALGNFQKADSLLQKTFLCLNYKPNSSLEAVNSTTELVEVLYAKGQLYKSWFLESGNKILLNTAQQAFDEAFTVLLQNTSQQNKPHSGETVDANAHAICESMIATCHLFLKNHGNEASAENAFYFAESAHASQLRNAIQESAALHYADLPDELRQKEYDLQVDIAYWDRKLQEFSEADIPKNDTAVLSATTLLFELQQKQKDLRVHFEKNFPDYYRLKYDARTASIQDVQRQLLDSTHTLLEYFVGDSSIFIFCIRPQEYDIIAVKKDFPLDSLATQFRDGLFLGHADTTDLAKLEGHRRYATAAHRLYLKLIAPVADRLTRNLYIIPDGALGDLPFEALLEEMPSRPGSFTSHRYLTDRHAVAYGQSATLLIELKQKQHRRPASHTLAAFAPFTLGEGVSLRRASAGASYRDSLKSLPYSEQEVLDIRKVIGTGDIWAGSVATLEQFKSIAANYRILHLSTHGFANRNIGDYSFLAFARTPDSLDAENLYFRDLFSLTLNADMVVLSACETGIGQLRRGEGIMGMTRAFTYAGAKSLFVTLWQVSDRATKELAVQFYSHLRHGLAKDQALWEAKKSLKKNARTASPYYWASMIGLGEMNPLNLQK